MASPWDIALLQAGVGMLGSAGRGDNTATALANGGRGALAGLQAVQQSGQADREHMLRMAQVQQGMEQAAQQRQQLMVEAADRQRRQEALGQYESGIQDPQKLAAFRVDPQGYIEQQRKVNAPMTAAERARIGLDQDRLSFDQKKAMERLAFDRDKEAYDRKSGGAEVTKALMTRARKIEDAMLLNGMSRAEATAMIDGQIKMATDPVEGGIVAHNIASGSTVPVEPPSAPVNYLGEQAGVSDVSIEEMAAQTGLWPTMQDVWARTAGQVDPSVVDTEKAKASTQFKGVKNALRSALMNNPRGPIWEQQQIDAILPSEGVLESPARAAEVMRQAKSMLEQQHDINARQIESGNLTSQTEKEMREKNAQIQSVHSMLPTEEQLAASFEEIATEAPADQGLGDDPLGLFD